MIKINRLILFIIISIVLCISDYFGFLNFFKDPFEKIVIPVKSSVNKKRIQLIQVGKTISQFPENTHLNIQLNSLLSINEELKQKVFLLTAENQKLREQLGSPLPPSYKFTPAPVISISRFMEIGIGRNDGIKEKMFVIDGNRLIGRISTVGADRSSVELLSDSNFSVPVKTERGTRGNLTGKNGTSEILEKILQKDPIFLNDQVWTSGEGGFPPNLLLGKITHITSEDVSAYKEDMIQPAVDISTLDKVFVINSL